MSSKAWQRNFTLPLEETKTGSKRAERDFNNKGVHRALTSAAVMLPRYAGFAKICTDNLLGMIHLSMSLIKIVLCLLPR